MPLPRVLPDTNVCFPISLLDLLLRLDEAGLHEIIWTEDLLEELAGVWVRRGVRSADAARRICDDIRIAFAGQDVPRADYQHLIPHMPGSDPDDHAHAAAAVARAPATIVTHNVADFPLKAMAAHGVAVKKPDAYLVDLCVAHANEISEVIVQMAADRARPSMTPGDVLDALARAGVGRFARTIRERLARDLGPVVRRHGPLER